MSMYHRSEVWPTTGRLKGNATSLSYSKKRGQRVILPTPAMMPVLRRAAAGAIICTLTEDGPSYTYEDGSRISIKADAIERMIKQRWLVPDRDTLLPGGKAQRYSAKRP